VVPGVGDRWQRCYRLVHVKTGGSLPAGAGELVVQGEDLGAWIAGQRVGGTG
jgi:hypothetical protein